MIEDFRLPDLGEGLPEAELVQWLVAEGDTVALNQTIAEVETAKAVVELPSPYSGTVTGLHAAAGDVIEVGSVLISFDVGGADAVEPDAADEAAAAAPAAATPKKRADDDAETRDVRDDAPVDEEPATPNLVGYGAAPRSSARPRRRARVLPGAAAPTDTAVLEAAPHDAVALSEPDDVTLERPRSTPPVRALAKKLGVDIALVSGTGHTGLITRDDVEAYAAHVDAPAPAERSAPAPAAAPSHTDERVVRTPIRGVRRHTAEAMVRSAFTAPHATTFLTVDVTETNALIASLRADRELADHRIGILAVAARAVCIALARIPSLNSRWDEAAGEIIEHRYVNLGIAAATSRGLVVPNIKDAQELGLVDLADAVRELADTARAGRTAPADMTGGTFSITNVGVFGVDTGTPILNPGEAGILALGAVRRQPWEHEGGIALRDIMTLALSFDHRLVDGEQAARFLAEVGGILREPGRGMLHR
ncbi:dihydrolipoamide acetyltransferase family protein [Microbacter sp. GSS18]|nr:dihydrolipoamide acetyltransferase family protein [Microbacter sp. GSS18]